jgi:Zn-finger nucleic acid-binding protein
VPEWSWASLNGFCVSVPEPPPNARGAGEKTIANLREKRYFNAAVVVLTVAAGETCRCGGCAVHAHPRVNRSITCWVVKEERDKPNKYSSRRQRTYEERRVLNKTKFQKKKKIYHWLMISMFALMIFQGTVFPSEKHKMTLTEGILLLIFLGVIVAIFLVMRCPNCNASLTKQFSLPWSKLKYCPKCGEHLE